MIKVILRYVLLLKILYDYGGINSKLIFHKLIYFFQKFNLIKLDYKFKKGDYGPFSEVLEENLNYLCELGYIVEEPNGYRTRLQVNENIVNKQFFQKFTDFLRLLPNYSLTENKIFELLNNLRSLHNIELASSIYYIIEKEGFHSKEEIFKYLNKWKPIRYKKEELKAIWNILISCDIISKEGKIISQPSKSNLNWNQIESILSSMNWEIPHISHNKTLEDTEDLEALIYNDEFWNNFIDKNKNRMENIFWDFKQALNMWEVSKQLKKLKQIEFCEDIAAFANKKGGVIFIGISDKIPRKIIGITDLENKMQSIRTVINKWIDYPEDFIYLKEVLNSNKRCLAIIIAQTKDVIGVKDQMGKYSYIVRLETGKQMVNYDFLKKRKKVIGNTNFDFLRHLT